MTPDNPILSVMVITYNHERFIAEALKGIIMQEVSCSMEVVVGEDFSSDGTLKICREFAEQHPNLIRLLPSEKNHGMMGNAFRTLRACRGKYIAFCEGDDYWIDPMKLQKQMDFMDRNPSVVFTFHGAKTFNESTGQFGRYYKHKDFKTGVVPIKSFFDKGGGVFASPSILYKREILSYPPWFTNSPIGDFPLLLLAIMKGDVGYLDDEMCVFRLSGGSWSESFKSFEAYHDYFLKEDRFLRDFNSATEFKFNKLIQHFNALRVYRLVLRFYFFDSSKVSRLLYLLKKASRMSLVYNLKSTYRIFVDIRRKMALED